MSSISFLNLKTRARQRADMENSQFIDDVELSAYINQSIAEFYDLLIGAYSSDYNVDVHNFTTVPGQDSYPLPATFYKLRGLDAQLNANYWTTLRPFNFNERNRNQQGTLNALTEPAVRYRLLGSNLKLSILPDGNSPMRLWFIPQAPQLVADTDLLQDVNHFGEYVIVDAAIKMLAKEESDVSVLMAQKAEIKRRVIDMAQNRDAGQPESVSDIYAENDDYWWGN